MPRHEYAAKVALDLLISKIEEKSPPLAKQLRSAIDAGKDVQAEETLSSEAGQKKSRKRYYRKHIAYTDQEALDVAMAVLESHLIESRMLVDAVQGEFKLVGIAAPKELKPAHTTGAHLFFPLELELGSTDGIAEVYGTGETKEIAIEGEPEAIQEKKELPDVRFISNDAQQLNSLREIFQALMPLTEFKESNRGDAR